MLWPINNLSINTKNYQMKKIFLSISILSTFVIAKAQDNVYPAPAQSGTIALIHATVHVGNGQVIQDGMVLFGGGKILDVRPTAPIADVKVIDCSGKQIYPGLISPLTNLGLTEINAVRSTVDERELGDNNANIRSIVAYNTDSKVINTLRSNGILLADVVPEGGTISGASSVVQLDAWNWEDAAYKTDNGIHFNMPSLVPLPKRYGGGKSSSEMIKDALDKIDEVRTFFRQAKAYYDEPKHEHTNIKFEAVQGLFNQSKIFFVHCNFVKEMMIAVEFAKEFNFKTVIVGGDDSWMITDYLKQNNIAVVLNQMHSLPNIQDDDVDQPYKTPYLLQQAGVMFCISDDHGETRGRNLMFNAGTAAAYGLSKEEALEAITLNTAKILGIDSTTGSLEKGKDANIVISDGDILDMKTSNVSYAFIQGRSIDLDNKHKQLYERYKLKYGLK
jgi:imidazolonepropionase-like amidohydrolase